MDKIIITGNTLTLEEIVAVCRDYKRVELSDLAIEKILESRKVVDEFVENEDVVYGITTGFGKFSDVIISKEESKTLQRNLIITHAVGAGKPFDTEVVRGIILLRVNNLAQGYSGAKLETIQTMIEMLNKRVHPIVPEKGSLGASGDLAPLSHMVLPMIGLGQAEYLGKVMTGQEAMKLAGIAVIQLTSKEGLALINGTQVMTAVGALTVYDALNIIKVSDIAAALSFEAQNGIVNALDHRIHDVRPHKGQIDTARNLLNLLTGSKMTSKQGEIRVQDAYSLRCVPQVHGASKDAINYVKEKVEIEINSVTDNPIIFPETKEGISGGNFHGQPMALSFDFLGIALAELANISER
ncbi:MAG: aromatic amino acid lyase, partial [Tissierellia bacterium]|nr:aromatic amino acid lyase [Tissierellia bacterium]